MPYDVIVGRNESDKKLFGKRGLIFLGKSYVTMGQYTSLSNPIYMDVARSHVVMISGKRGSGKCLSGDTLISLADGSQIPISELENNKEKIVSLNDKLKIIAEPKSEFFSREVNRLIKLKLRSGKEIKLTPEHPLFTIKGWLPAQELKIGGRIATPRKLLFGNEQMPENQVKLLAYLLAEGHISNGFVLFANFDEKIIQDFSQAIFQFDNNLRIDMHSKPGCFRVSQVERKYTIKESKRNSKGQFIDNNIIYDKSSIRQWLEKFNLYGKLSADKFIPQEIMRLKKEQMALFLNRLFSCDGSIYCKKSGNTRCWQISYASSSEKMIRQVQDLLLRFEILSRLRYKTVSCNNKSFNVFELVFSAENVVKFIEEIGFFGKKQEKEFEATGHILSVKRDTNVDTIPKEIWENFKPSNWAEIGRQFHYKYAKAMRESIDYSPSRQKLLKIAEIENYNPFRMLAMADIFWDEIVSMEILDGKFQVYDICVPGNHNFVANDIIVHNSYTLGGMAEAISCLDYEEAQNISSLIFDTMGIFWTMKFKNHKDKALLDEWGLESKNIPVKVFVPFGYFNDFQDKGIPVDAEFAMKISDLNADDWVSLFELKFTQPEAVLLESVISELKKRGSYSFEDIRNLISVAENISQDVKNSTASLFDAAESWKVFDEEIGTPIKELVKGGQTTVIDLSMYASAGSFNVRGLIIGLVSKKLFNERMSERRNEEIQSVQRGYDYQSITLKREMPLVWIFIDECLAGNMEIITDKAHTSMQAIVERFERGEKFKVLGFDTENKNYGYFDVGNVYKKGKRKLIKLITETGREIVCTPEHRVLTSSGFASAFSVDNIAFPLYMHYSKNPKLIEARILGHLFGDGWICKENKSLGFSGKGNREDLENIRTDLQMLGFKSTNIFERKTHSNINHKGKIIEVNGTSQSFQSTSAYQYFQDIAGFSGEKVLHSMKIPETILNGSNIEKAEFLAALMGSDGQVISSAKNAKGDFNVIRFSFNKIEGLEEEAFEFSEQIKKLFDSLGVKISKISRRDGNLRKDGLKTIKVVITLEKSVENTIKFLEKIGYRYCSKKEIEGIKWLEYLKARLFLRNQRQVLRDKIFDMRSLDKSQKEIAESMGVDRKYVKALLTSKRAGLPKSFLDIDDWIKNRQGEGVLFEKVAKIEESGEEEVYDLEVDKVHNFVSNGFITHNCHEFLPKETEKKTPASDALIQLLREGRQPGISMVMATQQPGKIHTDAMTQSDIVISHRVTAEQDVNSLNQIMQTYLYEGIKEKMNNLPREKGSAILLDDNSERIYPIRVRPRFTWHGGEAPTAIKAEKVE
jgi:intein/homing endonuclease